MSEDAPSCPRCQSESKIHARKPKLRFMCKKCRHTFVWPSRKQPHQYTPEKLLEEIGSKKVLVAQILRNPRYSRIKDVYEVTHRFRERNKSESLFNYVDRQAKLERGVTEQLILNMILNDWVWKEPEFAALKRNWMFWFNLYRYEKDWFHNLSEPQRLRLAERWRFSDLSPRAMRVRINSLQRLGSEAQYDSREKRSLYRYVRLALSQGHQMLSSQDYEEVQSHLRSVFDIVSKYYVRGQEERFLIQEIEDFSEGNSKEPKGFSWKVFKLWRADQKKKEESRKGGRKSH